MNRTALIVALVGTFPLASRAQDPVPLEKVVVKATVTPGSMAPAPDVLGGLLTVGAKTEIVQVANSNANLAEKTPRQVFARVPGVFVYDMDGSGNQVNISTRGLDAHRSWELNVRQDGVILNSDLYGYPASHYSPPMEAIQRIELIRGTAALQYGSQFGGLVNYVSKIPPRGSRAHVGSNSSAGSFGLVSTYASAGGQLGALDYNGYAQVRKSDGFRRNSRSDAQAQLASITWRPTEDFSIRGQAGRSAYVYQIPGPLNDSMFRADPTASTRSRNYFNPDIVIPSITADWRAGAETKLTAQVSGVFGNRSSVQFIGFANVPDAINSTTGSYAARQVDIDGFRSTTSDLRLVQGHRFGGMQSTLAAGVSLTINDLHRRQLGTGTTGTTADFSLSTGDFRRNIHYKTTNIAAYAENELRITPALSIVPGVRVENGETNMTGTLAYYDPTNVPRSVEHRFPLFGIRGAYRQSSGNTTYGGWSQAYRPMILQDLLPASAIERTDGSIRDARGWTLEIGHRGMLGNVQFDVGAFTMHYGNRFGVLAMSDAAGAYLFKTNVGTTRTRGAEVSLEATLLTRGEFTLRGTTATSFFDATYRTGSAAVSGQNRSVVGNRVEAVPTWITRNGLHAANDRLSLTALLSHVGDSFADALNTVAPSVTGAVGLVPAYTVLDVNGSARVTDRARFRFGVNNALDAAYFTKRPSFYPGPGVWPSDGRSLQLGVDFDLDLARR